MHRTNRFGVAAVDHGCPCSAKKIGYGFRIDMAAGVQAVSYVTHILLLRHWFFVIIEKEDRTGPCSEQVR